MHTCWERSGTMIDYLVPLLLFSAMALVLAKKENAYDLMLQGGKEGLRLLVTIVPALVCY